MNTNKEIMRRAFDAEKFRATAHSVVDQLADALAETQNGTVSVRPDQSPEEAVEMWEGILRSGDGDASAVTLVNDVLAHTFRSHHPKNLGHQVAPVLPMAAVMDLVGSLLDTGNGVYEVGNPATPMEHVVVKELAHLVGLPPEAGGVLTSGGSLGNLTALLAMRECQSQTWNSGSSSFRWRKKGVFFFEVQ